MQVINFELIKNHFEIEINNNNCLFKSLITNKTFDDLVSESTSRYKSRPDVQAFIIALQNLLEQGMAEITDGNIIVYNTAIVNLDKDSRFYLHLPELCSYRIEISQEGIIGKKTFFFNYKLIDNFRELIYDRIGCFIKVGQNIYLLSKYHYELLDSMDEFNILLEEEKQGIKAWKNIVTAKEYSDSIDIVFSQYLDQQNIVIPDKMFISVAEDDKHTLNIKPVFQNVDQQKFDESFNYFSTAQDSYTYNLDDGKKIRVIIPPDIKENLQIIRQRPNIRTEREKKLWFEKPHSFFPKPEFVSLADFSDRVVDFGLYKDAFHHKPKSEKDWIGDITLSLIDATNEKLIVSLDKDDLKDIEANIKKALQEEKPYIVIQNKTIPLSSTNIDEISKVINLEKDEKPFHHEKTNTTTVKTTEGNEIEIDLINEKQKADITNAVKQAKENHKTEIEIDGQPVLLKELFNNSKIRKFWEIHLIIDESDLYIDTPTIPVELEKLDFIIPSKLNPSFPLKKHQKEGLAWLQNCYRNRTNEYPERTGVLLADDMGLGKTLQILAFLVWLYENNLIDNFEQNGLYKPFLIIAPVVLLENWKREYEKFFGNALGEALILHGDNLKQLRAIDCRDFKGKEYYQLSNEDGKPKHFLNIDKGDNCLRSYKLVISNYETIVNHEFSMGKVDWSIIVLDEAQYIKEGKSYRSRIAKSLKADFKIASTGTPIENSLMDLWNIFDFLQRGLLLPEKQFIATYNEKCMTPELYQDLQTTLLFKTNQTFILRRTKAEELGDALPKKKTITKEVLLTDKQKKIYNELRQEACKNPKNIGVILLRINQLHQHPCLVKLDSSPRTARDLIAEAPKFKELLSILENIKAKNEKVIVFCLYHDLQSYLKLVLDEHFNLNVKIINGSSSKTETRQKMIDEFQDSSNSFDILILSPKAAGVGLNIVEANNVIHYGRWWNPAVEMQATDRVYRIGQKRDVNVYYLISKDPDNSFKTFDETLHELLMEKIKLSENFLIPTNVDLEGILAKELLTTASKDIINRSSVTFIGYKSINMLDHGRFEAYVACIFDKIYPKTILCPDGFPGIDVIAENDSEIKLIQCKHSVNKSIKDSRAINNVLDGKNRILSVKSTSKKISLCCITNSYFDKDTHKLANNQNIELLENSFFKDKKIEESKLTLKILDRKKHFSEVYTMLD
jgi:SNF2 family DNA or RNA helicase